MAVNKDLIIISDIVNMIFDKKNSDLKLEELKKMICEKHNISVEQLNKLLDYYSAK